MPSTVAKIVPPEWRSNEPAPRAIEASGVLEAKSYRCESAWTRSRWMILGGALRLPILRRSWRLLLRGACAGRLLRGLGFRCPRGTSLDEILRELGARFGRKWTTLLDGLLGRPAQLTSPDRCGRSTQRRSDVVDLDALSTKSARNDGRLKRIGGFNNLNGGASQRHSVARHWAIPSARSVAERIVRCNRKPIDLAWRFAVSVDG